MKRTLAKLTLVVSLLPSSWVMAQSPCSGDTGLPIEAGPACSTIEVFILDLLVVANCRQEPVTLRSRLGDGERAAALHTRRLYNVKRALKEVGGINAQTIEGGRTKGLGRVEVYVGDTLAMIILVDRNSDAMVGCAYDGKGNREYYPWKTKAAPQGCSNRRTDG